MTSNYSYTGSTQTYVVPSGVTSINIKAWGAGGGCGGSNGFSFAIGGNAAMVEGDLAVTPGQVLTINVAGGGASVNSGGAGGYGGAGNGSANNPGGGGFQASSAGGGGGGCTSILNSSGTNLVMVAGGGGVGSYSYNEIIPMASGGNGSGNGTSPGVNGGNDSYNGSGLGYSTNTGGRGAYYTSGVGNGGAGGLEYGAATAGFAGIAGAGGNGGSFSAGGGGSGWYGGGGGGGYGGGGGGGISLVTNLTNFTGYNGLAGVPDYGQPAGTGVGGSTFNAAGGNGYMTISPASAGVCFRETTRVLMADRTFKAIKDIQRGDEILTDKKKSDTKKVARTLKYMATGKATQIPMHLIGNRRTIVCSSTHPFWINDKRRILAGDIEGVEEIQISELLYTIQFEDEATYYVEGVKVDAVSPDHRKHKLPKELYFDQTKYKPNRVMKSEDDERRNKPNMTKTL